MWKRKEGHSQQWLIDFHSILNAAKSFQQTPLSKHPYDNGTMRAQSHNLYLFLSVHYLCTNFVYKYFEIMEESAVTLDMPKWNMFNA